MTTPGKRELMIARDIAAPPSLLFKAWTDPEMMRHWFAPKPWTTPFAATDVRVGGTSKVTMRSPQGEDFPNTGVYLEIIPNEKLVFTDAFVDAWTPSEKPFMVVTLTFEDIGGGKTRYTARASHWTDEDMQQHAQMGFVEGWGQCAAQLEELVTK